MLKRLRHQLKAFKTASEVIASRGEASLSWRPKGGCNLDAVEGSMLVAQLRRREQERLREGDRETTPPAHRRRERELDLERQRELQRFLPTRLVAGSGCGSGNGNGGGSGSDGNRAFPPEVSPIELWRQQQRRQQQRDERQRLEEQRLELRQRRSEEQQVLKRLPGIQAPRRTPSPLQCPAASPAIKYRGMPLLGLQHLDRARAAAMSARRQELRVQRQLLEEERKDREVVPFAGPLHALARFRKF